MKRKTLAREFKIVDHANGYDVTSNNNQIVLIYATICNDGNFYLHDENISSLPEWHQIFLHNNLKSKQSITQ